MPTLAEAQTLLQTLISAPEGVARALAVDDGRGGDQRARLARTVRGDDRLDATTRLDIYANMYFYRLLDVLADDYPAVAAVVGPNGFHNLITDYLLVHASRHHSARYVGGAFPGFLAGHRIRDTYPFLADLAGFEWALVDAFDAPDAPVLNRADLTRVPPDAWADLRLALHPAVQLLQSRWAVHRVRQCVDADEEAGVAADVPVKLCVWRQGFEVRFRELDELQWTALQDLQGGRVFAAVCETAAQPSADPQAAVQRIASVLAGWVDVGLFTALAVEAGESLQDA